jgi:hypothetical protein
MVLHEVRVHPSAACLPREAQLTWKIAELAATVPPPEADVACPSRNFEPFEILDIFRSRAHP